MFYCDSCADKKRYPKSMFKSSGICEICKVHSVCNETASSLLPKPDLFSQATFNGPDYVPFFDDKRLRTQVSVIFDLMKDGEWRTLQEIEKKTGYGQSSVSAQLRHLRKPRFGGHKIEKRRRGVREQGLFEYQLIENQENTGNI